MCDHPNRDAALVLTEPNSVWCDPCLAPFVQMLNAAGITTVQSDCGQGQRPGYISTVEGPVIMIMPDPETAELVERLLAEHKLHVREWDPADAVSPAQLAWFDYRHDYQPNLAHLAREHAAFIAGYEAAQAAASQDGPMSVTS